MCTGWIEKKARPKGRAQCASSFSLQVLHSGSVPAIGKSSHDFKGVVGIPDKERLDFDIEVAALRVRASTDVGYGEDEVVFIKQLGEGEKIELHVPASESG